MKSRLFHERQFFLILLTLINYTLSGLYLNIGSPGKSRFWRRAEGVTTYTVRRSGITNMYLSHKFTIIQMMHVSGHKTQKTFMDYIKLSSEEIADEIDAIVAASKGDIF